MQAASTDARLDRDDLDGVERDFFVRQLWDARLGGHRRDGAEDDGPYANICGQTLAHARSGDAVAISGYLGKSDADRALACSRGLRRPGERDHAALEAAAGAAASRSRPISRRYSTPAQSERRNA
jgi:hypothetical protein